MTDIHQKKIELDKKHLNKQMVQASDEKNPNKYTMGGALCRPPWLTDEKNFRFQMFRFQILGQNNVRN